MSSPTVASGLLLSGGVFALIYAYVVRFLVMPLNAVDALLRLPRDAPDALSPYRCIGREAIRSR